MEGASWKTQRFEFGCSASASLMLLLYPSDLNEIDSSLTEALYHFFNLKQATRILPRSAGDQ